MTTPTVTITVGGVPLTAGSTGPSNAPAEADALYMMYVQAVKDEVRYQWIVFPPANTTLGAKADAAVGAYMLSRVQRHTGNRSKWFHRTGTGDLTGVISKHIENGFTVSEPIVVPLEVDDYLSVWNNQETPHKAIRALDRSLSAYGLSIK